MAAISPVYFLYGTEDYLIEEETRRLMDQTLSSQEKSLNLHLFNGENHDVQEILNAVRTLPMFSKYRLILVRQADQMEEDEVEAVIRYLPNPAPSACLVLVAQDAGPWKRHLAALRGIGQVIEFPRLKGRALISWVRKRMEAKGKDLSEDAVSFLLDVVGDHLQDLFRRLFFIVAV